MFALSSGEEQAAKPKIQAAINVRTPTRLNEAQPIWIENLFIASTLEQKWLNHTPQQAGIPRRFGKVGADATALVLSGYFNS
ncbi:MAG: hypothetical protein Q7T25_01230 [Sideroxyarcus sp.]|nr:hypothetical protein [Sideroxyarcus sp.]